MLRLKSGADLLFISWHWQRSWWDTYSKLCSLSAHVITVRDDAGQLVGIVPLCARRTTVNGIPTRRLELIGELWRESMSMRSDYLQPMILGAFAIDATKTIVDAVESLGHIDDIVFSDVPSKSTSIRNVVDELKSRFPVREVHRGEEDTARFAQYLRRIPVATFR
jgi:hypothetical protein